MAILEIGEKSENSSLGDVTLSNCMLIKFQVSSFCRSGDMTGSQNLKWGRSSLCRGSVSMSNTMFHGLQGQWYSQKFANGGDKQVVWRVELPSGIQQQSLGGSLEVKSPETGDKCACKLRK